MRNTIALILVLCLMACLISGYAENTFTPDMNSQSIGLTGVDNARELGGYPARDGRTVRRGTLLRTARLEGLTEGDVQRLTGDYGLAVVADLRMGSEIGKSPDPELAGVQYLHIPIIDEAVFAQRQQAARARMAQAEDPSDLLTRLNVVLETGISGDMMYVECLDGETGRQGYRRLFEALIDLPEGRALLFHCTQGKDRTGVAAMLILSALDVEEDFILKDYLLTDAFMAEAIAGERELLTARGVSGDLLDQYLAVQDKTRLKRMTNALDWLKANYGSPIGYITGALGVTEAQLDALREKLLV